MKHLVEVPFPPAASLVATYLDGLSQGRLLVQRCGACGEAQMPPRPRCAACGSEAVEWFEAAGRGRVFASGTFHKAYGPQHRNWVPYMVAIVELEEGPRLVTNITGAAPDEIRVGLAVRAETGVGDDGTPLVRFRPVSEDPAPSGPPSGGG